MMNGPVTSGDLFFFYGLLKQGAAGMPVHIDLDAAGEFLGPARVRGSLYNLGSYPGIVSGDGLVQGVLYRLNDTALMPLLDEFEDVIPADPKRSLYYRERTDVLDQDGAATGEKAWVYWFNRPVTRYHRIADDNWPLNGGA